MQYTYGIEGKLPIHGEVKIGGSEDSALLVLIVSLLAEGPLTIKNIPSTGKVAQMISLLQFLGSVVERTTNQVTIDSTHVTTKVVPHEQSSNSIYDAMLLAALNAKFGRAAVKFDDPITDPELALHIDLLSELLSEKIANVEGYTTISGKVQGESYTLSQPLPSLTIHALLACVIGEGKFSLKNIALTAHVDAFIQFLSQMGVIIEINHDSFVVTRVKALSSSTVVLPSDVSEVAFWTACALLTNGEVTLEDITPVLCAPILSKIEQFNIQYKTGQDRLHVWHDDEPIKEVDMLVQPSKGLDIRMVRMLAAISTKAHGHSRFREQELVRAPWTDAFIELFGLHGNFVQNAESTELNIFGPTTFAGGTVTITQVELVESALLLSLAADSYTTLTTPIDIFGLYHDFSIKAAEVGLKLTSI